MLNALITLPIMYVLHQHVSSIVYLHLLHLCRKWLLKVLCFNMVVKNIVYCEPFSSSVGFIYHVLHHTHTVSVIWDFNPFIMHRRYTLVNVKWTVCVSRRHKLLHKQLRQKLTSWAITSVNIYFAWIYIHVGSIISCSRVTCHYQQAVWHLRLSCSIYITSLPGLGVTASHATY